MNEEYYCTYAVFVHDSGMFMCILPSLRFISHKCLPMPSEPESFNREEHLNACQIIYFLSFSEEIVKLPCHEIPV